MSSKNSQTRSVDQAFIDDRIRDLLNRRDPDFLKVLFTEVNPYLARVCYANGLYKEQMEDLVQQTWERFFINIEKFEGRSQIRTYICGILFNKIREHRRAMDKIIYEEDSEAFMNNAFTADGWWKVPPPDPLRISEQKQSSQYIEECLEGLTEPQRAAFVLTEIEEEHSEIICGTLEIKISHLRVLLFRAKDKLRKCLDGKMSGEGIR